MKTKSIITTSVVLLVAAGLLVAEAGTKKKADAFMRQKLEYSQNVLEGITLEQYGKVVTNGMHLWKMTQSNLWAQVKNEDYEAKSEHYRLDVTTLVEAARASNTTAILKSYTKVTEDCVDCHQHFRSEQYRQSLGRPLSLLSK